MRAHVHYILNFPSQKLFQLTLVHVFHQVTYDVSNSALNTLFDHSVQISFPPSIDFSQYNNLSLKWYKVHQNQILYDIPHELMFKNETWINFQNISIGTVRTFFKIMFQHWTWASWSSIPKPMPIPTAHTHANSYTS